MYTLTFMYLVIYRAFHVPAVRLEFASMKNSCSHTYTENKFVVETIFTHKMLVNLTISNKEIACTATELHIQF